MALEFYRKANKHEIKFDIGWMQIFHAGATEQAIKAKELVDALESAISLLSIPRNEITKQDIKEIEEALLNYKP
jgi:hypothetical protein